MTRGLEVALVDFSPNWSPCIYLYIFFQLYIKKVGLKMMSWCITSCNFKNKFLLLSNVKKNDVHSWDFLYTTSS